ncbi:c-type cytochrome [Acetobacteraceae bacterium H6797]|nr:c-type cytochrome [Acetobacteraceae bacterium H6797]
MRKSFFAATMLATGLFAATGARAEPDNFTEVERGRQLSVAGDCMGCHIGPDGKSLSGGHMLETPFGNISVPNITPDNETGIGRWSAADFDKAMRQGIAPGGMHLYPAFPYTAFAKMSRQDTDAIYAYLRAQDAVRNPVNRDTLPFPFNIRMAMIGWNMLNFTPGEFKPDPNKSAEYNRGAFLVEGPAHCGLCHTPRNFMGGDKSGAHLEGGDLQGWFAPDITANNRVGLGSWSIAEIVEYLKTGSNDRSAASGPMAEVVQYSTSQMPEADLRAIATYLKERGASNAPAPQPVAATDDRMKRGAAIYDDTCAACHAGNGQGAPGIFPRLANNQNILQADPTAILRVVLQGAQAVGTDAKPTTPAMPSLGWRLNDQQVADVATYIRNSWGNAAPAVTADQAKAMRERTDGVAMFEGIRGGH